MLASLRAVTRNIRAMLGLRISVPGEWVTEPNGRSTLFGIVSELAIPRFRAGESECTFGPESLEVLRQNPMVDQGVLASWDQVLEYVHAAKQPCSVMHIVPQIGGVRTLVNVYVEESNRIRVAIQDVRRTNELSPLAFVCSDRSGRPPIVEVVPRIKGD